LITPISIKDLFQLRSNVSHENAVFTCGLVESPFGTASSGKSDKSMRENVPGGQTHSYEEITFARGSRLVEKQKPQRGHPVFSRGCSVRWLRVPNFGPNLIASGH
jgi:hypothetical protein